MKRLIILFLVLQFFTNHEAFAEMVKLPFLFDHYNETASSSSFADFLKSHYSNEHNQGNEHDHGKLPFKHSDNGGANHPSPNISVVIKTDNLYSLKPFSIPVQQTFYSNDRIPSSFINNIWQPPKLA